MDTVTEHRRLNILDELARNQAVQVSDLSKRYGVSEVSAVIWPIWKRAARCGASTAAQLRCTPSRPARAPVLNRRCVARLRRPASAGQRPR